MVVMGRVAQVNALFSSLFAWTECQKFVDRAKKTNDPITKEVYERIAAVWRAQHEIAQAEYWQQVRP
jgi:hypothetical protein